MRHTFLIALLLSYSMLIPAGGCAWWQSKGKAEAVSALRCTETAVASQVALLISQVANGDLSALALVGEDIIACAAAALTQAPSERAIKALHAVRTEMNRRAVK